MLHDPLRVIIDWLQVHPVVLLLVGFVLDVLVGWGAPLHDTEWVVYAKKPFRGLEQVLRCMALYTHRMPIAAVLPLERDAGRLSLSRINQDINTQYDQLHDCTLAIKQKLAQ